MAVFENIPYTNFHDLNLDWIISIVKDFKAKYEHIEELIAQGESDIEALSAAKIELLNSTASQLETALNEWYAQHQAETITFFNTQFTDFSQRADAKAEETIATIPADYTALSADVVANFNFLKTLGILAENLFNAIQVTNGFLYYYETGAQSTNPNYTTSRFIPLKADTLYIAQAFNTHVCLWDSSHNFLRGYLLAGSSFKIFNSGTDAKYVTLSTPVPQINLCGISELTNFNDDILKDKYIVAENIINRGALNSGYLYYFENGQQSTNSGYESTDFIPCEKNTWYKMTAGNTHICLWDSNRTFIRGLIAVPVKNYYFNTGEASYITVSLPTNLRESAQVGKATLQIGNNFYPYTEGYIYKKVPIPEHREVTGGLTTVTACLKLPNTYKPYGVPTKLCVICHGASGGISPTTGWTLSADYNNIVSALNSAGYAVIDCNGYSDAGQGYNHWNCPQAISGYISAVKEFSAQYNLESDVYVYGFSMGALTALTIGAQNIIPVRAIMVGCPVISIYQHCVVQNGGTPRQDFLNAYEISAWSDEAVRGSDRYKDIITATESYNFNVKQPLFIGYGLTDPVVDFSKITEYYNALRHANSPVILKGYTGQHEVCYGGSADLIADMLRFFARY